MKIQREQILAAILIFWLCFELPIFSQATFLYETKWQILQLYIEWKE